MTKPTWREVRLGNILQYLDERVALEDEKEYLTITVKRRHGGLEIRERLFGHQIATKKQFRLVPGAFIISRVQCWHQAYAIIGEVPTNTIASTNYDQLAISPEVDSRFFWWFSHSPEFTDTIRSSASGVVIEKMVFDRTAWLEKTVRLPPLAEQRRMVARIDGLAAQIEECRRLRGQSAMETDAMVSASLNSLTSKIKPTGKLGELLASAPKNGWSARCDNADKGVPVLSLAAVTGFRYRSTKFKRTSLYAKPGAHFWLKPGDLLITRSNTPELVGHAAIYDGSPAPCIYPDLMMRLELKKSSVMQRFVWYWLQAPLVREFISVNAKGTSPTMKKISQNVVMAIPFPTSLPFTEQERIVAELDALQAELHALRQAQAETEAELDALVPAILDRAFNGEL